MREIRGTRSPAPQPCRFAEMPYIIWRDRTVRCASISGGGARSAGNASPVRAPPARAPHRRASLPPSQPHATMIPYDPGSTPCRGGTAFAWPGISSCNVARSARSVVPAGAAADHATGNEASTVNRPFGGASGCVADGNVGASLTPDAGSSTIDGEAGTGRGLSGTAAA